MTTPPESRTPLYPLGDLAKLKQDEGQAPSSPQIGAVTRTDLRPLVPLIIYWTNGSITQTNALVDTGAEASLIYRNPKNLKGFPITATGLGGSEIQTKQVKVTMSIWRLPREEYTTVIVPIPEYIIGIDLLRGISLKLTHGSYLVIQKL